MSRTQTQPDTPLKRPKTPEKQQQQYYTVIVSEPIQVKAPSREHAERYARELLYDNHREIGVDVRRNDE
jgi:hypothetical protein